MAGMRSMAHRRPSTPQPANASDDNRDMSIEFMSPAGRKVQAAIEKTIRECVSIETRADGTRVRRIDKAASDRIAALALADGRVDWDEDLLIRAFVLSPGLVFSDST